MIVGARRRVPNQGARMMDEVFLRVSGVVSGLCVRAGRREVSWWEGGRRTSGGSWGRAASPSAASSFSGSAIALLASSALGAK